ncbi:periplasmic oligopeptide-binding protein [Escherichia coli]|uniref:Periplasmic oligopeptide-binding protein n=1 Tax=Escherichia coli TaxID=562 RepID=A0A376L8V8_ECOLX|nr:periplasmic oligopeptide-binding protein [Escherichia coli]
MLVNTSNYNEGVQKTMTNITKEKFSSSWRFGCAYGREMSRWQLMYPQVSHWRKNKRWYVTMVQKFSH